MTDLVNLKDGMIMSVGDLVALNNRDYFILSIVTPEEAKLVGVDGMVLITSKGGGILVVKAEQINCSWTLDEETNEVGCVETNEENGETAMMNEDAMSIVDTKTETPVKVSIVRVDDDSDILEGFDLPEWKEEWEEASHVQNKLEDYMTAVDDFNRQLSKLHDAQRDLQDAGSELECALDDFIGELSDFEEKVKVPASNIIDDRIKELQERIEALEMKKEEWEQLPKRAKDAQKLLSEMKRHIEDGSDFEEIDSSIAWEDIEEAITN